MLIEVFITRGSVISTIPDLINSCSDQESVLRSFQSPLVRYIYLSSLLDVIRITVYRFQIFICFYLKSRRMKSTIFVKCDFHLLIGRLQWSAAVGRFHLADQSISIASLVSGLIDPAHDNASSHCYEKWQNT